MSVDARHPSCFEFEARLYVVPSWSGHGVAETRRSLEGDTAPRGGAGAGRWAALGALVGGAFLAGVAATVWRVDSLWALLLVFLLGAAVGAVLAVGTRTIFREGDAPAHPPMTSSSSSSIPAPLPVVEIPWDVARAAPEDSTGDELVLWSTLTSRFREAREALVAGGGADDRFTDPREAGARIAECESAYRSASQAYEPVARLLGFPPP